MTSQEMYFMRMGALISTAYNAEMAGMTMLSQSFAKRAKELAKELDGVSVDERLNQVENARMGV